MTHPEPADQAASRPPLTDPAFPLVIFGDFVCPWSYAALRVVDDLVAKHDLRPWWRPHLLHPDTPLEGTPYPDESRRDDTVAWLKEIAPQESQRMRFPDRLVHSFRAFQALEYAQDQGRGWEYKTAVFDALWLSGEDIAQDRVLQQAAESVGLDGDGMGRALAADFYRVRAEAAVEQAKRLDVTATPTMIVGRTRVNGWHYFEALDSVVEKQRGKADTP